MVTIPEIRRVLEVPQIDQSERLQLRETYYQRYRLDPEAQLWDAQVEGLAAAEEMLPQHGALYMIAVGGGKTLLLFLIRTLCEHLRAILLVPAALVEVTLQRWGKLSRQWRLAPVKVLSYESLSAPSGAHTLHRERPEVILADEAHKLRYATAARTKRVFRYIEETGCGLYVASGSFAGRGILDWAHLARAALRGYSPLPNSHYHLNSWAAVLDPNPRGDAVPQGALIDVLPLATAFQNGAPGDLQDRARAAFRQRLLTCPGIVIKQDPEGVDSSLRLGLLSSVEPSDDIRDALDDCSADGVRPDGEVLPDNVSLWRTLRQLGLGFYYRWVWPNDEPDLEWLDARRRWHQLLRIELLYRSRRGYDSPMLVAAQIQRDEKDDSDLALAYRRWRKIEPRYVPQVEAVWLDDSFIRAIANVAKTQQLVVWYQSIAVGQKLRELGWDVRAEGGADPHAGPVALPIAQFGTGRDLPHLDQALILEPPASGSGWEQLLGRHHRAFDPTNPLHVAYLHSKGGPPEEVYVMALHHTEFHEAQLRRALADAEYVLGTTGVRQKLLLADTVHI